MKKKIGFAISSLLLANLVACTTVVVVPEKPYKVGVVGFQKCRPDLVLKEIGYSDIEVRNEANECSRKGLPTVFAAELGRSIQQKLNKEVIIVPLDVPYNYNILSQIDIARGFSVDYLVGGKLDKYIDLSAVQRARNAGILPKTATLSPTPSKVPDNPETVLNAELLLARVSDGKIIAEYKLEEHGEKGGDEYTSALGLKIADDIAIANKP